ncbi:MAG: hypothetical protein ACREEM_07225 [Blastocatellia bacterium]
MEIEILNAMNEGIYPGLLLMIEVIVLITVFLTIAGFAIYLASIAWFCFEGTRQPARRQMKAAPEPPEPDDYNPIGVSQTFPPRSWKPPLRQATGVRQ